jgi:hypothetical protein
LGKRGKDATHYIYAIERFAQRPDSGSALKPLLTNAFTIETIENASGGFPEDRKPYPSGYMHVIKRGGLRDETSQKCLTYENMGGDEARRY